MNINPINANNQTFQAKIKLKPAKKDILKMGLGTFGISAGVASMLGATAIENPMVDNYVLSVVGFAPMCAGSSAISDTIDKIKENKKEYLS